MANPFLVLGGIAVGIITAAFGVLQVPGWVASAQDASAKNDVAQVSIYQSASLSQVGVTQASIDPALATDANGGLVKLGVKADTQATPDIVVKDADRKEYAVVVESESGKSFLRIDGGKIFEIEKGVTVPTTYAELVTLSEDATDEGVIEAP